MDRLVRCILLALAGVSPSFVVNAQVVTGSVVGIVRDPSGAPVPRATITATSQATGLSRSATSDSDGRYLIAILPVGGYTVEAKATGFAGYSRQGIVLEVAQQVRIDIQLSLSSLQQDVVVTGAAPVLNTDDATIGDVVTTRQVEDLPLNVRNFMAFTTLTAGTNEAQPGEFRKSGNGKGFAPSVAGLFPEFNEYRLDGTQNKEQYFNSYSLAPPVDSIQEFKIQVGQYSAESGGGGGGVVNVLTKSGTNQFHGSVYEFIRNDKLDARNFFATTKAPYKQNQFGASLGGPVVKNKIFFFGNYEGRRIRKGLSRTARVPTAAEAAGDLAGLGKQIRDPQTGQTFSGAVIPPSRVDAISQKILQYWPAPNVAGRPGINYQANLSQITDQDTGIGRYDHVLSSKDNLFVRYGQQSGGVYTPGTFTSSGGLEIASDIHHLTVGATHVFGPSLVNEARFGYNEDRWQRLPQNYGKPITNNWGLTYASPQDPQAQGFLESLALSSTSIARLGEQQWALLGLKDFEGASTLSWIHGKHNLRFGGDYIRTTSDSRDNTRATATYGFGGQYTGDGFADFLLGIPSNINFSLTPLRRAYTWRDFIAGFIADDWKATSRLTLNMGLRYELQTAIKNDEGKLAAFDPLMANGAGGLRYSPSANLGDFFTRVRPDLAHDTLPNDANYLADTNNFAPRFGFAYRPTGGVRTVIRGGYGWFFADPSAFNVVTNSYTSPPFTLWPVVNADPRTPDLGWNKLNVGDPSNAFAGLPFGLFVSLAPNGRRETFLNPLTQQWSFSVNQAVTDALGVRLEYIGSRTTRLTDQINLNLASPSPLPIQPRRPFPQYGRILDWREGTGRATYNALLATAQQRMSKGLVFTASYTWSKSLGNTVDLQQGIHVDPNNLGLDKGPNDFDVTHVFTANYLYELPFGPGKAWGGALRGWLGGLLGGWQTGGILTLRTGFPSSPTIPGSFLNSGENIQPRADVVKSSYGKLPDGERSPARWFDRTAFTIPMYRYGNASRNSLRQPGLRNWDVALQKASQLREGLRLEFRFEAFNVLNHANFDYAITDVSNPNFGVISSAGDGRDIQMSLKLRF